MSEPENYMYLSDHTFRNKILKVLNDPALTTTSRINILEKMVRGFSSRMDLIIWLKEY